MAEHCASGGLLLSVIIPAFNEEAYLPATLGALQEAAKGLLVELIVVDNGSTDRTRAIAIEYGARVVPELVHNIGRVRNAGAWTASGATLVFVDADTLVPKTLLQAILTEMQRGECAGGAVAVDYSVLKRRWMRLYLRGWKFWGRVFNMKQGAAQFCRREAFTALGGYDESIYVGEDVHFYWQLSRWARQNRQRMAFLDRPKVVTSARRFDQMGVVKSLVLTHPLVIWLFWKKPDIWRDWYVRLIR